MTKQIAKFSFLIYHSLFPSQIATCRFQPTCSQYAQDAIQKYGAVRGLALTIERILSCHPFSKRPIYDPI